MAIAMANEENFEELIQGDFVIVDFFSTTCVPCKMFSKILEDLQGELPFVQIVKVNTTEYPALGEKNNIQAVPTVQFYKNGTLLENHVGVLQYTEVKERISKYLYA